MAYYVIIPLCILVYIFVACLFNQVMHLNKESPVVRSLYRDDAVGITATLWVISIPILLTVLAANYVAFKYLKRD